MVFMRCSCSLLFSAPPLKPTLPLPTRPRTEGRPPSGGYRRGRTRSCAEARHRAQPSRRKQCGGKEAYPHQPLLPAPNLDRHNSKPIRAAIQGEIELIAQERGWTAWTGIAGLLILIGVDENVACGGGRSRCGKDRSGRGCGSCSAT
jgi:hypothetical protein